jgi:toxoflavin biosynthesis protein ToxC
MKTSGIRHLGPISGVAASHQFVGTAGYDGQVILWDSTSREPLACARHDDLVNQCAFSPDGKLLATASSDASMRIFSVPQLRLRHVYTGHTDDVAQVQFSPCGALIATCSYDGTLHVLDSECRLLAKCIGHSGLIERFSWRPDSRRILSCGTDGFIKQWDVATGTCIATHEELPYDVDDICYINNDDWVAAMDNGCLLIVSKDGQISTPAHKTGVKCLSKAGKSLLSIGYDQQYKLWELDGGNLPRLVTEGPLCSAAWARSGTLLDTGKIIMSSFGSRYVELDPKTDHWDIGDYLPSPSLNAVYAQDGAVYAIGDAGDLLVDGSCTGSVGSLCNALSVLGDLALAAGQAGVVFDAVSGESLYAHSAPINCIVQLPSCGPSKQVVFGGYDGTIGRLTLHDGKVSDNLLLRIGETAVKGLSVGNGRLFCGLADGCLVMVDPDRFEILHYCDSAHDSILNAVSFFDGGFVSVSRDLTMRRWRTDGQHIDTIRTRHLKSIKCCASSKDGRFTASGSYAGTVDVYDHRSSRWSGRTRRLTERGVSSLTWCNHRGQFLAAGYDGNVYEVAVNAD